MTVFPQSIRDIVAEIYVNSGWVDISGDVRQSAGIHITRGRPNESAATAPSSCTMTLDNRTGVYSPRNPMGAYYGSLGRNTPLRVAVRTETDTFTRTSSSTWGTSTTGGAWTSTGGGGSVLASDHNVAAGVGTQSVPVTNAYRIDYLAGSTYRDVGVAATVTVPFSDVLGGNVEPGGLMVSGLGVTDYFLAQVTISAAEVVSVGISHYDGTVVVASTVVAGLTYTGQALRARFQVEGQNLRAKVWAAASSEPYGWTADGRTDRLAGRAPGWVGIRSGVATGNTNPLPVVFSYDAFEVRSNRFSGEVSNWPQQWDTSGKDVYTSIEAAGMLRRLGQGASPLRSTLFRGYTTMAPAPLAYWPVEEGTGATEIASGIGGQPMRVDGPVEFASNSDFVGSAPIAKPNGSSWNGDVAGAPDTGTIQATFLVSVPSTGETDGATFLRVNSSGTAPFWDVYYNTGGELHVKAYDALRVNIMTGGGAYAMDGRKVQVSIELVQNGGNIDWALVILEPGASGGLSTSGTLVGYTVGALTGIMVSPYHQVTASAIGQVMARNYYGSLFSLGDQLKAYVGETARNRILRLCAENNIPFSYIWDGVSNSAAMGAQGRDTVINLIGECVTADMGSLYEGRSTTRLGYRARSSFYNQNTVLALDYAQHQLAPPFAPVDDDQNLRNDVTVTRTGGSSARATQSTGALAVTEPSAGGVGRYDDAVTVNLYTDDQAPGTASWLLHLGTVNEPRYPSIKVDLASNEISASPALGLAALSIDVEDAISVANPKSGILAPDTIVQLAHGYSENINAFEHNIAFTCVPESPYEVIVLDSAADGKIDSTTSVLTADITSGSTALTVIDDPGPGWTSDAAEMPIPITVGGETMSVTAISAAVPSFVAAGVTATGNNASLVPAHPAGLAVGDLKLIFASIRSSGTGTVNTPTGWTQLLISGNVALLGRYHQTGDTAPTVTFAGGSAGDDTIASMGAFRNASMTITNSSSSLNGSAQDIFCPAISVPSPGMILLLGWKQDDWSSIATPGGTTLVATGTSTAGSDAGLAWYVVPTAGPVASFGGGSIAVTGGASAISRGITVALGFTQTMTVTRSVNGVVKAHSAGESVHLTRPATIAL